MDKKKIIWITGSNFFDVDKPIVPQLVEYYDIYWIVVCQEKTFYNVDDIEQTAKSAQIGYFIVNLKHRLRSWRTGVQFWKLLNRIKEMHPDMLYVNFLGFPYLFPIIWISMIPRNIVVYACHDFKDHYGIKNQELLSIYKKFIFISFKNFQFFSNTQRILFMMKYRKKTSFYAPLSLKDFGQPDVKIQKSDKIVFLFFGQIRNNKGLSVLIKASNKLNKVHSGKFVVKIWGGCDNWSIYQSLIEDNSCFDLKIERVENSDIPNLFASSHFLVLPYLDVTQSGPLFISYNYGIPVIASNHPGFSEFIEDKVNGFLFQNQNEDSLFSVMCDIIEGKFSYDKMKMNLENYINERLSINTIVKSYCQGINNIIAK